MKSRGFTLVELLIVIAILATLYSIAAVNVYGLQAEARISRIKGDLKTLELALNSFVKNKGFCPMEDNYQTALFDAKPRIIDKNLMDPFGETINTLYRYSISANKRYFVVFSVGPKRDGTASISNNGDVTVNSSAIYESNGDLDLTK